MQASVLPPQGQRDWRALPRCRTQVMQERRREVNRGHGVLERAHSQVAAGAGVAPGNAARAGKQRSGRTRPGHQPLRTVLPQLAHAAARTPGTSLSALYTRRAARRGKQRAMVAVAHSMGVSALHRLSRQAPSQDVGAHSFDAPRRHHLVDRLTRRMEHVGDRVQ